MLNTVCLVPTYRRPEMLYLCLERIQQAIRPPDMAIWLAADNHKDAPPDSLLKEVVRDFYSLSPELRIASPHSYYGNSYNVLTNLQAAYEAGCKYLFVVEDDIQISRDFFAWHLEVLAQGSYFCSIGRENVRSPDAPRLDDASAYFLTSRDYSSHGPCLPRASLALILPHITPAYFSDVAGYCQTHFPDPSFAHEGTEQDGLILRLMVESGGKAAYPCIPRCFHAGYYGYHRKERYPQGSLPERVSYLRNLLAQSDQLAALGDASQETHPCSLETAPWTRPYLTPYENGAKPLT